MVTQADVSVAGVFKQYGDAIAVNNVFLDIAAGEMVALLGPSGCGKTTTLRMIAGLVTPDRGHIAIGGTRVTHVPTHKRNIGMLFQNYALFPNKSVAQNVAFGLQMRNLSKKETAERVDRALDMVKLSHVGGRLPRELSGGQQQRVALARALVIEPAVLLLDEPLGALDKSLRESMQVELKDLQRRLGITTVVVTHDQEEAMTLADKIVVMRGGQVEQVGTPEEIYMRPQSQFVADFIGAMNFIPALVDGIADGITQLALPAGAYARTRRQLPVNAQVHIAVRPEAVNLATPGSNATVAASAVSIANGSIDARLYGGADGQAMRTQDDRQVIKVTGALQHRVYRGALTHFHIALDGGGVLVAHYTQKPNQEPLAGLSIGSPVSAYWYDNECQVFEQA